MKVYSVASILYIIYSLYLKFFTNDTIVRVEAESNQIGKQVTIRHLTLNKYYILLELNFLTSN